MLLTTYRTDLIKENAAIYAGAIVKNSRWLEKCVTFIDGTKIKIARLSGSPLLQWSEFRPLHVLPFGDGSLVTRNLFINNGQYYIYGDQAYVLRPWMQTDFPRALETPEMLAYNRAINAAREAVE
eukprot:IDg2140t1